MLAHVAKHVAGEFFGHDVIDDGNYYTSDHTLFATGLITLNQS